MADKKTRYDENDKTMWVYRKFDKPKTLVPSGELKSWIEQKKAGETADGDPLARVNFVFAEEKTAEYNHQPLTFSKIGVYVGDLEDPQKYESADGDPDFETRKDFGIE